MKYYSTTNKSSCCVENGDHHRSCDCGTIYNCRECEKLCTKDINCKGFYMVVNDISECHLATSALSCPFECKQMYLERDRELDLHGSCPRKDVQGCFIKEINECITISISYTGNLQFPYPNMIGNYLIQNTSRAEKPWFKHVNGKSELVYNRLPGQWYIKDDLANPWIIRTDCHTKYPNDCNGGWKLLFNETIEVDVKCSQGNSSTLNAKLNKLTTKSSHSVDFLCEENEYQMFVYCAVYTHNTFT